MVIPKDFFHRLKTKNYITNPHDNIVTGNERLLISFDGVYKDIILYGVFAPRIWPHTKFFKSPMQQRKKEWTRNKVQACQGLGLIEREKRFTKELKPYHNSSSPSSSSLVNALKHSYKSIGSVCIFLLLSTLSCSVKTFSCELWYLRCSVVGSHSIAMYELLEPNSWSLHFITHPWQNLIRK